MIKKLYKDGNRIKFRNNIRAMITAISFTGLIFGLFCVALFFPRRNRGPVFQDIPLELSLQITIVLASAILFCILFFYTLRRPLFIVKENKLIVYDGIFWRNSFCFKDITSIKIFSDEESLTIDVETNTLSGKSFDMKSIGTMGRHIKDFLDVNVPTKVIYLDLD